MPQLAEINIAKLKYSLENPEMQEFVDNLERINQLAEQSPGYVWRLQDESGDATSIQAFSDPTLLINLSVWQDVESLKNFVYKTHHVEFLKKRQLWFNSMEQAYYALWWIEDGHTPTTEEAKQRLQSLQENGETEYAFSFKKPFPAPSSL